MADQLYIKTDGPLPEGLDYITAGKVYKLLGTIDPYRHGGEFVDDEGYQLYAYLPNSGHLGGKSWILCDEHGNPVPAPWEEAAPINYRAHAEALAESLELARIDLKEWLKSFPNASREPTVKIIERIDAALAAFDQDREIK